MVILQSKITIYVGEVVTHKDSAKGEKPVKMNFALHELPQDLYNDFITNVDLTKTISKESK